MSHTRKSLEEATLYALAMGCTRCQEGATCPMSPIQKLPYSRRFAAVDRLSAADRESVLLHAGQCLGGMSPCELRGGPFVKALILLWEVQQRIGTAQELENDMETAVQSAHELRNALMVMAARTGPTLA